MSSFEDNINSFSENLLGDEEFGPVTMGEYQSLCPNISFSSFRKSGEVVFIDKGFESLLKAVQVGG